MENATLIPIFIGLCPPCLHMEINVHLQYETNAPLSRMMRVNFAESAALPCHPGKE
jgi:hypothetical protein